MGAGVVIYGSREHGTAQKKQVMDDFQNGRVDAVITNSTTGYSLHASRTVADQRQRVMYIVQPHLDVNQVEQSIGRSHRSGQVDPNKHAPDRLDDHRRPQWGQYDGTFGLPIFKLVVGQDLPTEERAVAILMKKMSHLKANTTGNRSSSFGLIEMPDFINDYGNEVAANLMEQYPDLHADLDYPLGDSEELKYSKAIQKVTGRAVILTSDEPPTPSNPYPSLARQAGLYDTLTTEYKEFLTQKIALGENELEAQKLDLQAEPVSRLVLNPGDTEVDSPFTKPAYLVEVQAKTGAKPNTTLQVVNAIRSELGFEAITDLADHDDFERSDVRLKGRDIAQETAEQLRESVGEFLAEHTKIKEAEIDTVRGRIEKYQQRLDAQLAISTELTLAKTEAVASANIPLADQLTSQLTQQQPKIDKLRTQVSKAQLDLNGKEYQLARDGRITKANCEDICGLLEQFPVGQGVRFIDTTTKNFLYGVVAGVEQKGRANNPASPSNWKINLLVVDGVRSLSVRLDSLLKDKKQLLEPIETAFSYTRPQQSSSIYELFDERQTEAKEKRYLVSGQVLAAQLTGKFAQVTDHEGQVHPVYLLRRGFDPAQDLDLKPVKLETLKVIKQFLFEATGSLGVVQTENQNLTIIADIRQGNSGGIVLKTPKATAQGGLYFKDEALLGLTGDFASKTESVREGNNTKSQSIMTVTVPAEKIDTILSYVSGKWGLGAASHKNVARELLGQVLPSWEPCAAINPDIERVVAVERPPQNPTSNRNHLERVFDAGNVSRDSVKGDRLNVESNNLDGGNTTKPTYSQSGARNSPHFPTLTEPNSLPIPPAATTAIPLDVHTPQPFKQIAEPSQQHGSAEKNVAKLLHQAGLAASLLKGEGFHLKVENEPYIPLSIERQGQELYLTHFLKDRSGELFIDAEMVFNISHNGQLSLTETAVQNPLTGGEYRSNDQQFGKTFSKNLLEQGCANAAIRAIEQSKSPTYFAQDSINAAAIVQPPHLIQVESLDTAKAEVHPSTQYLLQLEPADNSPKPKPAATKTKQAKIAFHKEYQLHEPVGVQLNLFDVGLGSPKAEIQTAPRDNTRVKDVSPDIEESKTVDTLMSVSTVTDPPSTSSPVQNIAHNTAELSSDLPSTPMQIFQQVVDRVDKRTGDFIAQLQSSSPTLTTLRDWYRAARELGNAQTYLDRITEVANEFKQGKLLPDKAIKVMQADLQLHHKQLTTTELVSQLSNRDFLQLHQGVADHFKEAPPHPPAVADRQFVQGEIEQLQAQINHLWQKQTQQAEIVEAMQKNPFRIWNSKYDAAVAQVQATTGLISQSITQKEQKETQLKQWDKLDEAYQAWDKSPQTTQM